MNWIAASPEAIFATVADLENGHRWPSHSAENNRVLDALKVHVEALPA